MRGSALPAAVAALSLLAACGPAKTAAPAGPHTPTYYEDIAPIVSKNCSGCHVQGGIAPFALDTKEAVVSYAQSIKTATAAKVMPPWPPGADSPPFEHDRRLSDEQVALISQWVDSGAPVGDAKNAVELPQPDVVTLPYVSVEKDIGVDYTPDTSLRDDYRCFLVDLGATTNYLATGYEVIPGNRKTVHHVIVYLFDAGKRAVLEGAEGKDGRPGWQCFGGPTPDGVDADPVGLVGGWVPGQAAVKFVPGTGKSINAGQLAVVQVHYNLAGGSDPDRTRFRMSYASPNAAATMQPLYTVPFLKSSLLIPANTAGVVQSRSKVMTGWTGGVFFPDNTAYITSVAGHMHKLGTSIQLTLQNATGTHTLLDIPSWDFHWQGQYQLQKPILVTPTDTVTITCTYDNTAERRASQNFVTPMQDVTWGEGTEDEMCLAYADIADDVPAALKQQ